MSSTVSSERLHASCVAIGGAAVLIEGPSGSGKSDLSLRLIDRGARLVSDDYTLVTRRGRDLLASAPEAIAGKIEVRGLGIVEMPCDTDIQVKLLISLNEAVTRLPDDPPLRTIAGLGVPVVTLNAFEGSAPVKAELALKLHGLEP